MIYLSKIRAETALNPIEENPCQRMTLTISHLHTRYNKLLLYPRTVFATSDPSCRVKVTRVLKCTCVGT